ncbi:protein IQ-DOMAIN 1 [Dorcoceras hygrometricum]|uniref:Protein IQ-DOMAIN 1 n=1 Tax=Dorcoceras hygrometricum TaxID=472368 RepID=A0A2Z7D7J6_9LAMI|nr:protein IQ-DOMAIN 1 [Dorcoceras hygrometricum]
MGYSHLQVLLLPPEYSASDKSNGHNKEGLGRGSSVSANGTSEGDHKQIRVQKMAATRIQTAYRAHSARKTYRQMKGMTRFKDLVQSDSVKKQASTTLRHLHSWSRIQAQVRARRVHMVTQGRLRQKNLENKMKLDAKLHDLEVDWSGGSETMDEALARIHQREEAAVKRERAMAYAFSHQWRANSNPNFGSGNYELGKENWGWSWMDRWIAARPWESRVAIPPSPKKAPSRQESKTPKSKTPPTIKTSVKVKLISPNAKAATRSRKLSYEASEKTSDPKVNAKAEDGETKNERDES